MQKRGFTLIELLVVISIIGVLASIVLASLGSVRRQGANTGVAANLSNLRTRAELFAQSNGYSYDTFCTSVTSQHSGVRSLTSAVSASGIANVTVQDDSAAGASLRATCHDSSSGWAAEVPLATPNTSFWCVDYLGFSGSTTVSTLTSAGDIQCN